MFTLFPARPFTETSIEFRFVERPDYTKARAVYKDFLTLWKDADLDSPQPEAGQSRVRQVAIEPCVPYASAAVKIRLSRHFLRLRSKLLPSLLGSSPNLRSRSSGHDALLYALYFMVRRIA
jgi:hypothetical protein